MKNHQLRNWQTIKLLKLCFNPHTHEGCDGKNQLSSNKHQVSIHTPTKGVTQIEYCRHYHDSVSIHTPIQGVTHKGSKTTAVWKFQSTHPYRVWRMVQLIIISKLCFNPHTHTGCDIKSLMGIFKLLMFQSTHTYRVWHYSDCHINEIYKFQSTHPYRVWLSIRLSSESTKSVSIHTPIQGVTPFCNFLHYISRVSIHTPIQGVTAAAFKALPNSQSFNPHTHTGCDSLRIKIMTEALKFQSTHPYRVWLIQR